VRPAEVVRRGADYLARHDVDAPLATAEQLMMSVLKADRAGVYARKDGLDTTQARSYGGLLCRRCAGTPTQHLTGEAGFRRLVLEVRPGVFVPRPETETLVDVALQMVAGCDAPLVADIGTGTGAIALAIRDERPDARVFATDRSAEATALARSNAARLQLDVEVFDGDLVDALPEAVRGRVDLIVSNPPYLDPANEPSLPAEVRADPPMALYGGLEVYERSFTQALAWLRAGGGVAVEVDPRSAGDVADAAARAGFVDPSIHPDLAGRARVVAARRP